jgi:hypothetical protein
MQMADKDVVDFAHAQLVPAQLALCALATIN